MRLQAVPHCVPLLAVDEVGLGLLDVKVHGVRGAVGYVKVLPWVLVAGLGLSCSPAIQTERPASSSWRR